MLLETLNYLFNAEEREVPQCPVHDLCLADCFGPKSTLCKIKLKLILRFVSNLGGNCSIRQVQTKSIHLL